MRSKVDQAVKIREGQSLNTDSLETYLRNNMQLSDANI